MAAFSSRLRSLCSYFQDCVLDVSMPDVVAGQFPPAGPWIAIGLAALLIWLVGQLAVIRLAMEPHVAVGEAIMHAVKRLVPYVLSAFLWLVPILILGSVLSSFLEINRNHPSVAVAVALIVLSVVAIFLAVRLMLSSTVASSEEVGPLSILQRSWSLTRGNWWRLFAFVLLFWIGALCLLWAVESVAGVVVRLAVEDSRAAFPWRASYLDPKSADQRASVGGLFCDAGADLCSAFRDWCASSDRSKQRDLRSAILRQDSEQARIGEALDRAFVGSKASTAVSGQRRRMIERAGVDVDSARCPRARRG